MPKLFLSPWVQDFTGLEIPPNSSQIPIQSQSQVSSWISFLRNVGAGDPAVSSAQSVATKNGLAVISGQQIGLGIGPILSLYKIFAIENLAEHFSKILNQKVP